MDFYKNYFNLITESITNIDYKLFNQAVDLINLASKKGGKVIIVGNGGSAAMASHVAVDFTKAAGIRAINFNDADLVTCFANDYSYEEWVVKALCFYADPDDLAILISSSGTSPNIIKGATKAKELGLKVLTLSGFSSTNPLRELGDINFWADSNSYNIVEMTHHIWLVAIVDYIVSLKS